MSLHTIVFDFDGTLIDSNEPKRRAFFELFPGSEHATATVGAVLEEMGEASRYEILAEVLERLGEPPDASGARVTELADQYNELALSAAAACPERPFATEALTRLAQRYSLYVSSMTPQAPLAELVRKRGWERLFVDIFGYPRRKAETIDLIMRCQDLSPDRLLVVGDGRSDRESAAQAGCGFFPITGPDDLKVLVQRFG